MKRNVAMAVVLASLSDREVLDAYQVAAKTKDPLTRQIGRELLVRFHRMDPTAFPLEVIDEYDRRTREDSAANDVGEKGTSR